MNSACLSFLWQNEFRLGQNQNEDDYDTRDEARQQVGAIIYK